MGVGLGLRKREQNVAALDEHRCGSCEVRGSRGDPLPPQNEPPSPAGDGHGPVEDDDGGRGFNEPKRLNGREERVVENEDDSVQTKTIEDFTIDLVDDSSQD